MAFTKFATILFLVGFLTAQVSCMVPIVPSTTSAMYESASMQASASMAAAGSTLPMYPDGTPNYYNANGLPMAGMYYPFYSAINYSYSSEILSDFDVNMELARYSYMYNMPASSLYSMYNLIHSIMPNLPTENDLSMLRGFAEAYQAERMGYVNNYKHPLLNELYTGQLSQYLPNNYPRAYLNMLGHLDSLVPRMSTGTYSAIHKSIYDNISPALTSRAEYLNFAISTSMRYMAFSYTSWGIRY